MKNTVRQRQGGTARWASGDRVAFALLAGLVGGIGGLSAVAVHRHIARPVRAISVTAPVQAVSRSSPPTALVSYATAAALLNYTGVPSGRWFVRTRHGHTQLVLSPSPAPLRQEGRHALP